MSIADFGPTGHSRQAARVIDSPTEPSIPNISGLNTYEAAEAYSAAGLYLLPVRFGKHPGSIVGKNWPDKSSRDAEDFAQYWDCDKPAGIAVHMGPSGLVAFDVDADELPAELDWLRTGAHQASRAGDSDRGHYVFASADVFRNGALTTGDGRQIGEIRSGNAVIMAAPSPHAKVSEGGLYRWLKTGPVPPLPDVARPYLTTGAVCGQLDVIPADDDQVAAFMAETAEADTRPAALDALTRSLAGRQAGTRDAVRNALRIAAGEARIGFYPYRRAVEAIERAARESYIGRGLNFDDRIGAGEFRRLVANGISKALARDVEDIRREANRDSRAKRTQRAALVDGFTLRLVSEAEQIGRQKDRRNAPLDLRELRTAPPQPISWLLPGLLARDSYVSLSAAPGTGKSVLARSLAVDAALGRSALDPADTLDPARVVYLDAENGPDWWRAGLDSMAAPLDVPNLAVVCYPDLGGLDTSRGAGDFLALIAELADDLGGADLVVLDTVSRFIDGGENDADTWSQFYRLAIQPLRDKGIAVLRLDHLGKDADRGPRGSSHKLSDVDADFRMTAARFGSDELTLTLGKRRRQHFAQMLSVRRRDDPLRHELSGDPGKFVTRHGDGSLSVLSGATRGLIDDLDRLGVPAGFAGKRFGRASVRDAYRDAGGQIEVGNDVWAGALRELKARRNGKTAERIGAANSEGEPGEQP